MQQPYVSGYPQGTGTSAPPPPSKARVIVDPKYCSSHPVDLAIVRKIMKITDGNFVIKNGEGNVLFKVKDPFFSIHEKRILVDGYGTKVLTLKGKIMTMHDRWRVFRGGSTEESDLLYTVKRSNMIQLTTKLDVFLADNIEEKKCDYRVEGVWLEKSCVVYAGNSDIIVAQVNKLYFLPFSFNKSYASHFGFRRRYFM
ncbi:unnamed protein product [Arabidopsis halleri]